MAWLSGSFALPGGGRKVEIERTKPFWLWVGYERKALPSFWTRLWRLDNVARNAKYLPGASGEKFAIDHNHTRERVRYFRRHTPTLAGARG
jgi:hypothetical protein